MGKAVIKYVEEIDSSFNIRIHHKCYVVHYESGQIKNFEEDEVPKSVKTFLDEATLSAVYMRENTGVRVYRKE